MIRKKTSRNAIRLVVVLAAVLLVGSVIPTQAAELGHYAPALPSIRDFILPDPGFYYVQYHLYYTADTLKDKNGKSINAIKVDGIEFDVETEVDSILSR